jgi:hypothetical protein
VRVSEWNGTTLEAAPVGQVGAVAAKVVQVSSFLATTDAAGVYRSASLDSGWARFSGGYAFGNYGFGIDANTILTISGYPAVWRSTDGGQSFENIHDELFGAASWDGAIG